MTNDLPLRADELEFMRQYPPQMVPEWTNLLLQAHAAIGLKQDVEALQLMVLKSSTWWDETNRVFGCHHCPARWLRIQQEWHSDECPMPSIQAAQL